MANGEPELNVPPPSGGDSGEESTVRPIFPSGYKAGDWAPRFDKTPPTPLSRTLINADGTTEQLDTSPIYTYIGGEGAKYWNKYSPETRNRLEGQMVDAGLLGEGNFEPGGTNKIQHDAWEEVLGYANYYGLTPFNALSKLQAEGKVRFGSGRGGGGGGGRSTAYTIPDYPTIAQNAKDMLRNTMGREMEDWEISLAADELQRAYRKRASQQLAAQGAGSGEFEVTDPGTVTQAFIEDSYADELSRIGDVAETSVNYKLAMDSFTTGAKMAAS